MKLFLRVWLLLLAAVFFTACGGGGGDGDPTIGPGEDNGSTDGGSTGGDTGGSGDGSTQQTVVRFGSFTSGTFTAGAIASNKTALEAGQSATLSVSFVDQNTNLVTDDASILFTSTCIASGLSEVTPAIINNTTGTVSVTYTARGCSGQDTISAQTALDGTTYGASVQITTTPAPLGSISFASATPAIIGIKGSGAIPEQSVVSFLVTDATGNPVPNQDVTFTLNNTSGGITLSNTTDTSNASGIASTTVASGTVATSVRVTATAIRDAITSSAQSSALAITTGIPDHDSFSLSATTLNIEGYDYDGITTTLTLRAADRFNNPVPDGTAIAFQAEGASVQGSCVTSAGACSVELTSQRPRPADGRVTVLASGIGEESFTDSNPSNGRFDDAETFIDLPEAFRDDNENGVRDSNEPYVNFDDDVNETYDAASGLYEGLLCKGPSACNPDQTTVTLSQNIVIVLSGSSFFIDTQPGLIDLDSGIVNITVNVVDAQGQVPPAGSIIEVSTSQGSIEGDSSFTQLSTNAAGPSSFFFRVKPGDEAGNGTFTVKVTTPRGVISSDFADVVQTVTP